MDPQPDDPPRPVPASVGMPSAPPLTGVARDWDRALRALDGGLWAARNAAFLLLISPCFLIFLMIGMLIIGFLWVVSMLLFLAGGIAWWIGLRRLRRLAGTTRVQRDVGAALAVLFLFPLCGLGLYVQTTLVGGLMTIATALVLLGMNLVLTRVALEGLAGENGIVVPRAPGVAFWPIVLSCTGLVLSAIAALGRGEMPFVVAIPFVLFGLLIAYFRRIGRCRELVRRLWRDRRVMKGAGA